jgi:hypothetical protein
MAHGYARDYDDDFDRGEDRERGMNDGDWGERDRPGGHSAERGRDRNFMFEGRDHDRGFMDRAGERASSWFDQDERDYRPRGEQRPGRRSFSSHPDDHYLSWRDKQMQSLDQEYQDYCREREQRFHQEFDQWRQQRRGNNPPLQAGMTQTGPSKDTDGIMELTDTARTMDATPDPMADATLGSESSGRGRR